MREKTTARKIQKLLDKLVENPQDTETRLALGKLYFLDSQFEEAVGCYRKLLEVEPRNVSGYYNLAVALTAQKKMEEAKEAFQKVLELDPDNKGAQEELAKLVSFR